MLFNSPSFLLFLPVVFLLYRWAPLTVRKVVLLGASYYFYGSWNWKCLGLLIGTTVFDYLCAIGIGASPPGEAKRRRYLVFSLVVSLTVLGVFKYFNFFMSSFSFLLADWGVRVAPQTVQLILPIGISFYTFQSLSYVIDVYRWKIAAEKNLLDYALYVSFFPQLVAGPIERAGHLLPQLKRLDNPNRSMVHEGIYLVLKGYLKKVVLGDSIASRVDTVFTNWEMFSSLELFEGAILFALQVYFDFSGYSDIARGVSRWFGIQLADNFHYPYFASNIADFWRRWHMTLSTWFQEYLYVPLGGNRHGRRRQYWALWVTLTLSGLWHGANWTFIVWGMLHGFFLICHKEVQHRQLVIPKWVSFTFTQLWVVLALVIFRAPRLEDAWGYLSRLFSFTGGFELPVFFYLALILGAFLLIDLPEYKQGREFYFLSLPVPVQWSVGILATLLIAVFFSIGIRHPFIYFQF